MSSIGSIASHFASSAAVAGIDLISSANAKGVGALFEKGSAPAGETYKQVLHDEALEPAWETLFCSILTKIAKSITPNIPEQITMIPGKLIGAAWHWGLTSHQSTNTSHIIKDENTAKKLTTTFYNSCVKGPSEWLLDICGLGEGKKNNFLKFGLSQIGIFSLLSFGLKNTEENLPGVNLDSDESFATSLLKGAGYTVVEQATYAASQAIRFYTDFSQSEFNFGKEKKEEPKGIIEKFKRTLEDKDAWAKSWANVVNERFFPGHILSGIAASMSTWYFGKNIPKVTAAALGEFPTMLLNRIMNAHRRRATKDVIEYKTFVKDGKNIQIPVGVKKDGENRAKNYRFSNTALDNVLDFGDLLFNKLRDSLTTVVASVFRGNRSLEDYRAELIQSREISEEFLQKSSAVTIAKLLKEGAKEFKPFLEETPVAPSLNDKPTKLTVSVVAAPAG